MGTIPVYSFVAFSGTGKTTLLEKVVGELKKRSLRVAVIKHDAHNFEIDKPGKDSYRMTQAGADVTVLVSPEKAAIMENRPVTLDAVLEKITDVDIILTEGYKHGKWKKIALLRAENNKPLPIPESECFAIASDVFVETDKPQFALDDAIGITEFMLADIAAQTGAS